MLRLVAPRAVAHGRLLAAVLALVTTGVTQLGLAALLLGSSAQQAFDVATARATAEQVDTTAFVAAVPGAVSASVVRDTRRVLVGVMSPLVVTTTASASSAPRRFPAAAGTGPRVGYLGATEGLDRRARFVAGRAPRPGATIPETALPQTAATALGLAPGRTVRLEGEIANGTRLPPVTLRVVGVFRPLAGGWDRDLLGGAGTATDFHASVQLNAVPAYGPFLLDLADLVATGSTLDRFQVTAHPDLSKPSGPALDAVLSRLGSANALITAELHQRVSVERIESPLPTTLAVARTQATVTRAAVLVVVLLGIALTSTALALAARLVAALRGDETALLASLGSSRPQLLAGSAAEAAALAAVSALLAVPLAGLAHAALTHLPAVRGAGLATGPSVTAAAVVAIVVGAVLLTGLLVVPALRPEHGVGATTRGRVGLLVRSGGDVLVVGLAAVGLWQLRVQPPASSGVDVVRAVAPVLCLVAGSLLALRLLPPVLAVGDRLARRSRTLVLPLATFEAARRPQAAAAALLVVLGTAAGTFGVALLDTWNTSQHDQADLRAGTDLRLALASPGEPGQGAAVTAATGGTVSPATRRNVLVGQWLGDAGQPPQLVAVDLRRADAVLRGRLPGGQRWGDVGARLAPTDRVAGLPFAAIGTSGTSGTGGTGGTGPALTVTGGVTGGTALLAAVHLVVQEPSGARFTLDATPVPLDGARHPLQLRARPAQATEVVAVEIQLSADPSGVPPESADAGGKVTVDIGLPGTGTSSGTGLGTGTGTTGAKWSAASVGLDPTGLGAPTVRLEAAPGGTLVRTSGVVTLVHLYEHPAQLLATAFTLPETIPVAVSRRLADATGTRVDTDLPLTVGTAHLVGHVVEVLPDVPSVPAGAAVLADVDLVSRALVGTGDLTPVGGAWWVGGPTVPDAEARLRALALGTLVSRAGTATELTAGPLRAVFPVALAALVPLALLLVLAGAALNVTADLEARRLELAQLRAVGLRRSHVRRGVLVQHATVSGLLVLAGAVVGWVAARLLGPLLTRSESGGEAVPDVRPLWPWATESLLVGAFLAGCAVVAAVVAARRARRADATQLRLGAS